jgi:hypothetical protein
MPFVDRDAAGRITATYARPQREDHEFVDADVQPWTPPSVVWERIKVERDRRRLEGGVKVSQHWFLSHDRAVGEYTALATIGAALPDSYVLRAGWRTMAQGVTVDMTPALVRQILQAGFATLAAIDDAAQAHRAAMEASSDPAGYDFSTGWPPAFGDPEPQP